MPNTFFGLTIGTTGLYGANMGINTTAHNISNAETEGYTRQILNQKAESFCLPLLTTIGDTFPTGIGAANIWSKSARSWATVE